MYDLDRIKKEFISVCEKAGVKVDIPIYINPRLSTTLGQVVFTGDDIPIKVDFSKILLETANDESIHQIILHEAAHLIAAKRDGVSHGHDAFFKAICAEIGCTNDKTTYKTEKLAGAKPFYKYEVHCPNCGYLKGYNRKGDRLKNIKRCYCRTCKSHDLFVIQNR